MSTQLPLRDYQEQALAAVRADWASGVQRPAVVAPTGAGKTVMFAHLINEEVRGEARAVVLVHRDELADQAMDKIRQVAPDLRVGKVKAGDNQVRSDVVVASVQTLATGSRLSQLLDTEEQHGPFGLVVVDECHHAVAPSWRRVLEGLGAFSEHSGTQCVGFSATLARGDEVGLGSVWQKVSYAISLTRLIRRGYLADVRGVRVTVEDLDLAGVRRSGGDYQAGALGDALTDANMPEIVAEAYLEHAKDRQGVVFTPTVDTAIACATALDEVDIPTEVVTGDTPRDERRRIYAAYQGGEIQVLANCMVLTEGFDAPWASCAVIARPTQSTPLYTQMVGRVLRPWPGKTDALVLDVVGAAEQHKLATLIDLAPGTVHTVRPDQTLTEAVEEAELAALEDEQEREAYARQSRMTAKDVDLFAQSRSVWLRTPAGVWFIPTREGEFFLWPSTEPGMWDVCVAPSAEPGMRRPAWERLHTGCSLDLAMSWAQTEAEEVDASIASKASSWRKGKVKPSEAQLRVLTNLRVAEQGVDIESLTKTEASDLISIGFAARIFDRHYRKVSQ